MQMRNTYINRLQNIQRLRLLERALEELLREEAVMMSGINELYVLSTMHFTSSFEHYTVTYFDSIRSNPLAIILSHSYNNIRKAHI